MVGILKNPLVTRVYWREAFQGIFGGLEGFYITNKYHIFVPSLPVNLLFSHPLLIEFLVIFLELFFSLLCNVPPWPWSPLLRKVIFAPKTRWSVPLWGHYGNPLQTSLGWDERTWWFHHWSMPSILIMTRNSKYPWRILKTLVMNTFLCLLVENWCIIFLIMSR